MGMFGILIMIGENELSAAGVYNKVNNYQYTISPKIIRFMNSLSRNFIYICMNSHYYYLSTELATSSNKHNLSNCIVVLDCMFPLYL